MGASSRVSVLIPTYNRARYLRECLESILAQTVAPFEVIVIDDGSEDETPEAVAAFGPAVRYLRKDNGGKPRAINFALPEVRGEFVWIFDDDDVALPDAIERRLAVLTRRPELGFVLTGHYLGTDGEDGRMLRGAEYRVPEIAESELWLALMRGCFVTMQSMLVRTAILRQAGEFDPQLVTSEDYDMMLRLAALAPFALLNVPTFIFRQHSGVRGPRGQQYEAVRRQRMFQRHDGVVGRKLRESLPLGAYLVPPTNESLGGAQRAAGLMSRMEVMASKGLIPEMLDDLVAALQQHAEVGDDVRHSAERCCRAICTGYAYQAIAEDFPTFQTGVGSLKALPGGRAAILYLARGFLRLAKSYPGSWADRLHRLIRAGRVALLAI